MNFISFLAVGWGRDYRNEDFVVQGGIKHQLVNLISSVQTLLRGEARRPTLSPEVSSN